MKLHTTDPIPALGGARLVYIVSEQSLSLLRQRHFRGRGKPVAGNFATWETPLAAFNALHTEFEPYVIESILEDTDGQRPAAEGSVELDMPRVVGWSCMKPLSRFEGVNFEVDRLSHRRTAWMVPTSRRDLLAPQSYNVTILFKVQRTDRGDWICSLYNLRPGTDLDVEEGDATEQTGYAFFRFGHPGEPLA